MGLFSIVLLSGFIALTEGSHPAISRRPVAAEIEVKSSLPGMSENIPVLAFTSDINGSSFASDMVELLLADRGQFTASKCLGASSHISFREGGYCTECLRGWGGNGEWLNPDLASLPVCIGRCLSEISQVHSDFWARADSKPGDSGALHTNICPELTLTGLFGPSRQPASIHPEQSGRDSENYREDRNNSIRVFVNKKPGTAYLRKNREQEIGQTFWLMLIGLVIGYGGYAFLKRWGENDRKGENSQNNKYDR